MERQTKGAGTRQARHLPDMTVQELARRAGEPAHVVRYYTRIGLLKPGRHPGNGYRLYGPAHLKRLLFVRQASQLGYTLREIATILRDAERSQSPCPRVRGILARRIDENRQRLAEMQHLQQRMERALKHWERMPDGMPDGESVCHLIESAAVQPKPGRFQDHTNDDRRHARNTRS